MTDEWVPRFLDTVLVEAHENTIVVTWGLGEPVPGGAAEFSGYGVYYYDPTGYGGKRLGVRFSRSVSAHIFDNASATQSNYGPEAVQRTPDAVVVTFNDASLGLGQVGTIAAFAHIDGQDVQVDYPVTLLR